MAPADEIKDIENLLSDLEELAIVCVDLSKGSGLKSVAAMLKLIPKAKNILFEIKLAIPELKNLKDPGQKGLLLDAVLSGIQKVAAAFV